MGRPGPLIGNLLLPELGLGMVAFTGILVLSQMAVSSFKSFCQGDNDLPGSNLIIVLEEATFLPAFGALWLAGFRDGALIVVACSPRASSRGDRWPATAAARFFRSGGRIDLTLARQIWRTPFVVRSAMSCC